MARREGKYSKGMSSRSEDRPARQYHLPAGDSEWSLDRRACVIASDPPPAAYPRLRVSSASNHQTYQSRALEPK